MSMYYVEPKIKETVRENVNNWLDENQITVINFSDIKVASSKVLVTMYGYDKYGNKINEIINLIDFGYSDEYVLTHYLDQIVRLLRNLAQWKRKEYFSDIYGALNKYNVRGHLKEYYNFSFEDQYESSSNLEDFRKALKNVAIKAINEKRSLVTKILDPVLCCETENSDGKYFDFIRIEVSMESSFSKLTKEDRISHIKKYQQAIIRQVLRKIENNTKFQNVGIPANCLKLGLCTMRNSSIVYQFELKTV